MAATVALIPLWLAAPAVAQAVPDQNSGDQSGEIVVTAQRRDQSIQDVPYNISAVSGADLAKSGVVNVNSLTQVVAGLTTIDNGPAARGGTNNFSLRGLRTDGPNGADEMPATVSSVSTYFGDTPVFFPIVLKDIQRVEVLRGPQGTLYGSGAQGGTIRFIPNRPDFNSISGEMNVGGGISEHSSKANGNFDAVLNMPITPRLAIRAVGGVAHLGGFIDAVDLLERDGPGKYAGIVSANPASLTSAPVLAPVQHDVNSSDQYFGRLAVRWQPVDMLDLDLTYAHQETKVDDIQASNPTYGGGLVDAGYDFQYPDSGFIKRPGGNYESTFPIRLPSKNNIDLISGTATVDFGLATFTSVSSYVDNKTSAIYEYSNFWIRTANGLGGNISNYGGFPRFVAVTDYITHDKSFTQEVRLVSKWDKPIDYVIGGYFQRQKTFFSQTQTSPGMAAFGVLAGFPSASPEEGDLTYSPVRNSVFVDRALFGELTYHVTPKLQVTGGARFFWQKFKYHARTINPYCGAPCSDGISEPASLGILESRNTSDVSDHVIKINTSYDFSRSFKVYATYAEGFRRGGANGIPTSGYYRSLPIYTTYAPDVAKTYEVGVKGSVLDRKLQFSADLFLINLDNFQFNASTPSYAYGAFNGQQARSKGGEIELSARISPNFTMTGSYTYTDATVSKPSSFVDYPSFSIVSGAQPYTFLTLPKGQRLPGVPKHTFSASGDYTIPVDDMALTTHLDASYRSSAEGAISTIDPMYWKIAPIFTMNGRISLDSKKSWAADLFVNNITNALGYTGAVGQQFAPNSFAGRIVMRPRTYGLGLRYRF
ncbi:TonB-dependent receptor [Sphingobium sp. H39-3-25]|uniref:TonB-dependent receptor n=1 Tax=Sphingobium arseniciresistens TaxID=3030834 RepID=UPI0023B99445|nr:TonB-dependent receptor [Sphingobium arseniciresistens]